MDNSGQYVGLGFRKEFNISPLDLIFKAAVEAVLRDAAVAAGL